MDYFGTTGEQSDSKFLLRYKIVRAGASLVGGTVHVIKTVPMLATRLISGSVLLATIGDLQANDIITFDLIRDIADAYSGNVGMIALRYRAV